MRKSDMLGPLRPAAVFRFASAATGAWVVTSDPFPASQRLGAQFGHDGLRTNPLSPAFDDLLQRLFSMGEEMP